MNGRRTLNGAWARAICASLVFVGASTCQAQVVDRTQECELVKANQARIERALSATVPLQDPAQALSKLSCLDALLNMRLNLAFMFDLDALIAELVRLGCAKAQSAWNNVAGPLARSFGQSFDFNDFVNRRMRW